MGAVDELGHHPQTIHGIAGCQLGVEIMIRLEGRNAQAMAAILNLIAQQPQSASFLPFQCPHGGIEQMTLRFFAIGLAEFAPAFRLALLHIGEQILGVERPLAVVLGRLTDHPAAGLQRINDMILKGSFPCFVI